MLFRPKPSSRTRCGHGRRTPSRQELVMRVEFLLILILRVVARSSPADSSSTRFSPPNPPRSPQRNP